MSAAKLVNLMIMVITIRELPLHLVMYTDKMLKSTTDLDNTLTMLLSIQQNYNLCQKTLRELVMIAKP